MNGVTVPPDGGFQITANFTAKQISGNAGCNDYSGNYVLTGAKGFAIKGEMTVSSKICIGGADVAEVEYLTSLIEVTRWTFDDPAAPSRLTLANDDGSIKLVFNCPPFSCPVPSPS